MGTVPDPLRSAKLSLVAASEEENGLEELQSPKKLPTQTSIERSSNGLPYATKMQPTGDCLLEVNCATVPRSEQCCGYDTNQPSMFSSGSISPSKEDHLVASELANTSQQEGSDVSGATKEIHTSAHATDKVAADEKAGRTVQTELCQAVDEKSSHSGGGDCIGESKPHDYPSLSAHSTTTPKTTENVSELTTPEKISAPALATQSGADSDLEAKPCVCSDAELVATKDADSQPSTRTVLETVPRSELESTSPSPCGEAVKESAPEPSKFRDTSTMTVQPGDKPGIEEKGRRTHQDAEVQAVASVESKSASTSPSIFAAYLRENLPSEAKQKQEQLHIIYTGAGGKEQSEIVDRFMPLVQTSPSTGIIPDVRIQASTPIDLFDTRGSKHQEGPTGIHDTVCLTMSGSVRHPFPLPSEKTQKASVSRIEPSQISGEAGNLSGVSQSLLDSSILLKTTPVYQITVNTSNSPVAPPHPVNTETELPPKAALPESSSCHKTPEKSEPMVDAHDSVQREHLQNKTVGGLETGPVKSHVDVKPKREEKLFPPKAKSQEMSNIGAAAEPMATCTPITFPKGRQEVRTLGCQNLEGGLESEPRRDSIRGLRSQTTKSNETKKEKKVHQSVPVSAQPVSNIGEKKKERKSATETKAQLKQSKRIRDVVWDEQGMTWEVYGASLDPESLGIAIQNHLQRQIREHEKLIKTHSSQNRKSISSDTSSHKKLKGRQHNVFQSMMQNFRRPNCCVRPAASSVLD